MSDLQNVVNTFAARLTAVIQAQAIAQVRSTVFAAFGVAVPAAKRRGRPPKALLQTTAALAPGKAGGKVASGPRDKARKKAPLQLCPVPGCKNAAAPVFGMVCAKHKDLAKTKIRRFREARQAKKLKAAGKTQPPKRGGKRGRKQDRKPGRKQGRKQGRKPGPKPRRQAVAAPVVAKKRGRKVRRTPLPAPKPALATSAPVSAAPSAEPSV